MTKSLLFAVTLLATGLPTVAAVPDVQPGLEALRSGRFEDARVLFDRIAAQEAAAPEGPFFQAFDLWWRLLDEPADADALRRRMEDFLEEATRRADRMRSARDEATRERGLVFSGVSMLLSAQSLAGRGRHFRAGTMARRGHRRLVRALKIRPGSPDAFFALGAYDYYADKLPAIVKGLRFLLMIPGGDDKRGISRLETAAEKSRLFGTESLMLLSHIYASKFEKNYRRALAYSRRALERHPSSPLIGLAHASLLFKVGRFRSAAETARAALEVISRSSGYSGEMARYAQFRLAACALQTGDPLAAMDRIESTLQASIPTAPSEIKRWLRLMTRAAREIGQPDRVMPWLERLPLSPESAAHWRQVVEATPDDEVAAPRARALAELVAGDLEQAKREIQDLIARYPIDPRLQYDMGRLLQQEGHLDEARPFLETAAAGPPSDLTGWATMRLGWALEQEGERATAIPLYKRAAGMEEFNFRAAALDRLAHPGTDAPEG